MVALLQCWWRKRIPIGIWWILSTAVCFSIISMSELPMLQAAVAITTGFLFCYFFVICMFGVFLWLFQGFVEITERHGENWFWAQDESKIGQLVLRLMGG